ncbi:MAG: hypothetical protein K8E66_04670 [Phycisphaerales bacterium]|nr:hypothetical protein [Phycisphaerales bacterium]
MNKILRTLSLITLAPFALTACSEQGSSHAGAVGESHDEHAGHDHAEAGPVEAASHSDQTPAASAPGEPLTVANFSFTPASGWTPHPPSNSMRLAELHVANPEGEPSVAVFSAAGGDVEMNITRWIGQFSNPGVEVVSGRETKTIAGQTVHIVEMSGEFRGMGTSAPQPDTMMRAAIVEQADGQHLFIKMTGTVDHMKSLTDDWNALIDSLRSM